jgi:hypothetical protein
VGAVGRLVCSNWAQCNTPPRLQVTRHYIINGAYGMNVVSVEVDPTQSRPRVTFRAPLKSFKPHYEQFCSDNQLKLHNVRACTWHRGLDARGRPPRPVQRCCTEAHSLCLGGQLRGGHTASTHTLNNTAKQDASAGSRL